MRPVTTTRPEASILSKVLGKLLADLCSYTVTVVSHERRRRLTAAG
jgi:hypothetical protein